MRRVMTTSTLAALILGAALAPPVPTSSAGPPGTLGPIPLDDVGRISIGGTGQATVAVGSPAELTINGPPEAIEQLAVTVDRGVLLIVPAAAAVVDPGSGEELRYEITVERLSDIRLRDDVGLDADGIGGRDLDLDLDDNTMASVTNVELEELDAAVRGMALLRVTGATAHLEVDARDSSAFDGTDLLAGTAEVEARDMARVVVEASTLLDAEASDGAIVEHVGAPAQTELDVRGSGVVRAATGTLLPTMPGTGSVPATIPETAPPPSPATTATAGPTTHEVSLAGRVFNPAVLEVSVGDTVTWVNDDDTEHTVTAFDAPFDSGELAEGASFSFTFDAPGEFRYRCLFHSEMQGTIVVA